MIFDGLRLVQGTMAHKTEKIFPEMLQPEYKIALIASGLVDDVKDIDALNAKLYKFCERDFVCQFGDAAEALWVIVKGSVAVREGERTLFLRQRNEVVGEQNLLGNGCRRWYDLVVDGNKAELLEIRKQAIEEHPQANMIWRNIAKVISLKLKETSIKISSLGRQLEDDTRILRAYTNEYAMSRRLQSGGYNLSDYKIEQAIVWFSDIVKFSRNIVQMNPGRTADIVQRFFNAQSLPIASHGGYIDKFMGDGLMAFWVISEHESADLKCMEALRAAEEAVTAVARIKIGNDPLDIRIGLHIGEVLSGDFGSATRNQFTLIGPEVNKAARLEQAQSVDVLEGGTDIGPVRMSIEFREKLADPVQKRYGNRIKVKNKNIGEIELFS